MPNDASIQVAVSLPWGSGDFPAFSLRRVHGSKRFLHEMILHKMIDDDGNEYRWEYLDHSRSLSPMRLVCKTANYKTNLLVVNNLIRKILVLFASAVGASS